VSHVDNTFILYATEDPDNRGSGSGGGGVHMRTAHGDVSPEDIFNMFFNNMAGGGGAGFHVYSTGFGPGGVQFRAGRPQGQRRQQQGQAAQQQGAPGLQLLFQLLPIILIALLSFMSNSDGTQTYNAPMPGENKYFSLTVSVEEV
jgi:hypothetical protein